MLIDLDEGEISTLCAALINHSSRWREKADKGTEGRATCEFLAANAWSLYEKLQGQHLPLLAVIPQPVSAPASAAAPKPSGGLKVVSPAPPPKLPPAPAYVEPILPKLPPRAVQADIEF